jgi:hypothetical protein
MTTVIDASLGRCGSSREDSKGGRERVQELFKSTFRASRNSSRRCAPRRSSRWSSGRWSGPACWRKNRTGAATASASWNIAIAPLAPGLPARGADRLHRALSVIYGIEAYVILRDIWGETDSELERTVLWMADALDRCRAARRQARRGPSEEEQRSVIPGLIRIHTSPSRGSPFLTSRSARADGEAGQGAAHLARRPARRTGDPSVLPIP